MPLKLALQSKDHNQVYLKDVIQMMDKTGEKKK